MVTCTSYQAATATARSSSTVCDGGATMMAVQLPSEEAAQCFMEEKSG